MSLVFLCKFKIFQRCSTFGADRYCDRICPKRCQGYARNPRFSLFPPTRPPFSFSRSAALVFRAGFNRPNLRYEVIQKPSSDEPCIAKIADLINTRFPRQSGIVYCMSRNDSEKVADQLRFEFDLLFLKKKQFTLKLLFR